MIEKIYLIQKRAYATKETFASAQRLNLKVSAHRGQQTFVLFVRHFKTSDRPGHFYSIFDLQSIKWKGDEKMDEFRDLWDHYLGNIQTTKEIQREIQYIFLGEIEKI